MVYGSMANVLTIVTISLVNSYRCGIGLFVRLSLLVTTDCAIAESAVTSKIAKQSRR